MRLAARLMGILKLAAFLLLAWLLANAATEFYNVAWGTGTRLGGFSTKWGIAFLVFALLCLALWLLSGFGLWRSSALESARAGLVTLRGRIGFGRWLAAVLLVIAPIWLLQYSPWGVVFGQTYIRLLIWFGEAVILSYLISWEPQRLATWGSSLTALLASGAAFTAAAPLAGVTSYPFALGWSEGNRLWDYSLLFGLHLYRYPAGDAPAAYLEPGRELVGALPFLIPGLTIWGARLWQALLDVVPYLILGLVAFRPVAGQRGFSWVLAGIWGFMFLAQGPIHPPLLIAATLVVLAWGQSLWLAVPLLIISGFYVEISRFTWIFAPAMWAVMLEFGSAHVESNKMPVAIWRRAIAVVAAGLFGSLAVPRIMDLFHWTLGIPSSAPGVAAGGVSLGSVTSAAGKQPLLWYRLFPNATYGSGVLIGLLLAAGPLIVLLIYLAFRKWKLNGWQKAALVLPLLAFLVVGLIISTKIGGGGDLHNLDMFLIGLLFCAAIAWRVLPHDWVASPTAPPIWVRGVLLIAICLPAFQPLMALRPLSFANDENWLVTLTGVARAKDLGSLPAEDAMQSDLAKLRQQVAAAQARGDVLFIDQRQLLTFGFLQGVELIPQYEKKRLMDEALSSNLNYFQPFYRDLAAHRFALIISDPLRTPIRDTDYGFGEENNAWVKWIAKPVLCYYEEQDTLTNVHVELLVPRKIPLDCTDVLP